jgi:phosphoribosyl 1,2-cyclic phosphate phosphodiesterase
MVEENDTRFVIDTGPDFRMQMLRENVQKLDAILFTHEHKDHTAGLDDVRVFCQYEDQPLPVFATFRVQENLRKSFDYIFAEKKYPGIPNVVVNTISENVFYINGIPIIPIEVFHYKLPVTGFRIHDFVYITDANAIPETERAKIYGCKVLVINALRIQPHISHFSISEAVEMGKAVNAESVYFIHISHQLGLHAIVEKTLPTNMHLAYDKLKLQL